MWDKQNGPIVRTSFQQPDVTGTQTNFAFVQQGSIAAARLPFATDASNADTIGIGGKTFKFLTTLIAADSTVQVKRGTSAAATLANLVAAINSDTTNALWVESTTPFAKTVVADAVTATVMRLRYATKRGGTPKAGAPGSIVLAEALTPAASIWNCSNLNVSGQDPTKSNSCKGQFIVEATMVTAGSYDQELSFTPTQFRVFVTSSAGVLRSSNEAVTISGNALHFVMAGGASPNLQATDIVYFEACE